MGHSLGNAIQHVSGSAGTVTLPGRYYDGRQPIGSPATLIFAGREAAPVGTCVSQRYAVGQLRVSPRVGRADRLSPCPTAGNCNAMVKAAKSSEEVLAVLAHEIGHVELRHAMRHVLQDFLAAVVAATITADAALLSVAMAGLPAVLARPGIRGNSRRRRMTSHSAFAQEH